MGILHAISMARVECTTMMRRYFAVFASDVEAVEKCVLWALGIKLPVA
jgi:hypothetical protein